MNLQISKSKSYVGFIFIILAAVLSSLLHVVSKPMLGFGDMVEINPILLTFLIYMICTAFFTPVARKTDPIRKFSQRDLLFMFLIGASEVAALATYFFGLQTASVVNASIFSNSEIIFSLVIAMTVFKERLNIKECIPFSMIIVGMMIIPIGNDLYQNGMNLEHIVAGDLLIILAGFFYAVDITLCKYIGDRYNPRRVTQITSFFCAIVALALLVLFDIPIQFDLNYIPNLVILSVFGTGMSTLLFLAGLKLIGAVRTILLYSTTSIFGIIFAGIFLAEEITSLDIVCLVITLTGIFFLRNKLAEAESEPEITTNEDNRRINENRGIKVSTM
ncbi:DMT family transporter [Nitrosopumilus sp. S4]